MYTEIKFIQTKKFAKLFKKLVGKKEEDINLFNALKENPELGVLIKGTGGLRKLRWARQGMGKSGGVRIIYYFYNKSVPLFLLDVYAKNDKDDLNHDDIEILTKAVKEYLKDYL